MKVTRVDILAHGYGAEHPVIELDGSQELRIRVGNDVFALVEIGGKLWVNLVENGSAIAVWPKSSFAVALSSGDPVARKPNKYTGVNPS